MRFLVTGLNGTVAPVLAVRLRRDHHDVAGWDRARVSPDDREACSAYIAKQQPDWVIHLAMGSPDWAAEMAATCLGRGIRFLFTSTVSVFDGSRSGPFARDQEPDARDEYGRYKAECERRIRHANPDAIIARLGWQIGDAPGNNNMVDYLDRTHREKGGVEVSSGWIPSAAYLGDAVEALYALCCDCPAGLYQLEGNPGWTFFQIATELNKRHGNAWNIVRKEEPRRDGRMDEDRVTMGKLDARFR